MKIFFNFGIGDEIKWSCIAAVSVCTRASKPLLYIGLQIDAGEDSQEEYGWKLVHGDVFRPPRNCMLLAVMLGSGVQVFSMTLITLGELFVTIFRG